MEQNEASMLVESNVVSLNKILVATKMSQDLLSQLSREQILSQQRRLTLLPNKIQVAISKVINKTKF